MDIPGVEYHRETDRNHQLGVISYDTSPPVGGPHAPIWADCAGTVYPNPIASENAVHSLEHGAVWITYRPGISAQELVILQNLVVGQDGMFLSPYPGLKSKVSLQTWGYQLYVSSVTDTRTAAFIGSLRNNPTTTPEYGATCSLPAFKLRPSTPGHPLDAL